MLGCMSVLLASFPDLPPPPVFDRLQFASNQKLEAGEAWE